MDRSIARKKVQEVPKKRPEKSFSPGLKLTVEDTMDIVDTSYPKILQGRIAVDKAEAKHLESKGAFDPFYKHISEFKRIQDITVTGKAKNALHNEGQIELPTKSGVRMFGRFRVNPNDASTPFLQSGQSGEYTAGLLIPLLQGLGINKDRALEQKAGLGRVISRINLNLSRMNVLYDAAITYWDWIVAYKKLQVTTALLELGEAQEVLVRQRVADGDLPAILIAEAEKEVRKRRGDQIGATRSMAKAGFKLALFLSGRAESQPPSLSPANFIEPEIKPREISEADIASATKRALSKRPELQLIDLRRDVARVELRLARNLMLPQVNLIYRQGADTGTNGIGMVLGGGVEMSVPLRQRRARGLARQAELDLKDLDIEEQFLRQRITLEVEDAASEVNAAFGRLNQAEEELERARRVEQGEQARFDLGDSSLLVVNLRQRARAEAEKKRIETYGDYLKGLAAFEIVSGNI
ncbi:MAG: TolC family protein [Candidatus Obscuribacterales bacterium]